MPHAVEDHLSNRAAAVNSFAGRFIIDGLRQAGEGSIAVRGVGAKHEAARRGVRAINERTLGILLGSFLRRQWLQQIWGREIDDWTNGCRLRERLGHASLSVPGHS